MPDSVSLNTVVTTGYAPLRRYLAYFAVVSTPRVLQNSYHVWKKEGKPQYIVNRLKVCKWPRHNSWGVVSAWQDTIFLHSKSRWRRWRRISGIGPNFALRGEISTRDNQRCYTSSTSYQKLTITYKLLRIDGDKGKFAKDTNKTMAMN